MTRSYKMHRDLQNVYLYTLLNHLYFQVIALAKIKSSLDSYNHFLFDVDEADLTINRNTSRM